MSVDPRNDLDRAIDEVLASMVGGEPRRVSGPAVRRTMGERRRSGLPVWLAAAAVLIVALASALRGRAPVAEIPPGVAQAVPSPAPAEASSTPSPEPTLAAREMPPVTAAARRPVFATTTEPIFEGLPRLAIAPIDAPDSLRPTHLDSDPIQIPRIEIAPLTVSSLSPEQEHK